MLYAIINSEKTEPSPGLRGYCPFCNFEVYSRCGEINIKHWAHEKDKACEGWYEPESDWHRKWKKHFPKENVECIIKKGDVKHIADVQTAQGIVIELQNSTIQSNIITRRESFYGSNMVWIVNGEGFKHNFTIRDLIIQSIDSSSYSTSSLEKKDIPKNLIRSKNATSVGIKLNGKAENADFEAELIRFGFEYIEASKIYYYNYPIKSNFTLKYLAELVDNYNRNYLPEYYTKKVSNVEKDKEKIVEGFQEKTFHWSYPRKSWTKSGRTIYVDFGEEYLFEINEGFGKPNGRGFYVSKQQFIEQHGGKFVSLAN